MFYGLASFSEKPEVSFKDQEDGEVALLLLRKHFVTNVPWLAALALLLLTPVAFLLSPYREIFPFLPILPVRFLFFIGAGWYLASTIFFLISFSGWFFNINLVTNKRILDVDYWGFLYFNVAETPLTNIQDITYSISGLSQTFFNYGTVQIQTAGTAANFEFALIPNPAAAHDLITDVMRGKHA